jgi:hypothetical protein
MADLRQQGIVTKVRTTQNRSRRSSGKGYVNLDLSRDKTLRSSFVRRRESSTDFLSLPPSLSGSRWM